MAELAAVAQGRGLGHVQNGVVDIGVAAGLYAADGVGVVLGLGKEFCRRAGRAFGIEHIYAGTASGRAGKGIGVDGDEYVCIACTAFGNAYAQWDKDVFVARHEYVVTQGFEAFFGFAGDGEYDVFFFEAARADCARVFAAMTGVDHNHRTAVAAAAAIAFRGRGVVCDIGIRTLFGDIAVEQGHHRVVGICAVRIEVDNQAVFEVADGCECEDLRMGALFEVDDNTHCVGSILTGANAADKRVVRQHFAGNALQDAVDFRSLNIHDQPAGVVQHKMLVFHRVVALKGNACVGVRRPNADGKELRRRGRFGQCGTNGREGEK